MILVVGGTGWLGRPVAWGLLEAGVAVRALVRSEEKAGTFAGTDVEVAFGDLGDEASLARAVKGVTAMFLCSSLDDEMVTHQVHAVEAARSSGVRHVVKLSAQGAGDPDASVPARWHREVEQALEASGMRWTHLRSAPWMQNIERFHLRTLRSDDAFRHPYGTAAVAWVDLQDVVDAAVVRLTGVDTDSRAYELTGPEAVAPEDLAVKLSHAAGRTIVAEDVPPAAWRDPMIRSGMSPALADAVVDLYRWTRRGGAAGVTDDVASVTGHPARKIDAHLRRIRKGLAPSG